MQMLPALVEEDLESFGKAINHIQTAGFKRREVELQSQPVLDIMKYMRDNGASGSGISSFGPVVYGIVGSIGEGKRLQQETQRMLDKSVGGKVLLTKARNRGAEISGGPD
jgi:beta-ribofuranosylaminobenzene 5'-phosphate synthase